MSPQRVKAYILLIIVSIIWALAGPIIKFTLGELPPLIFLTYRFAVSSIFGLFIIFLTGFHLPKNAKTLSIMLIYAVLTSTITLGLLFLGLEKTTVVDMSLISISGPIMVAIAGVIFLKEHVTKKEKIGMTLALTGMAITVIEPLLDGDGVGKLSGNFLIILYLLGNSASVVLLKILLRKNVKPFLLTNISFIVGFLSILPVLFIKYDISLVLDDIGKLPFVYHLAVFYMAILSGNIAYSLGNIAQKTIEVSEAALFSYLYPILSIPLAVIWLKERVTSTFLLGATVIAIGIFIAEYKKSVNKV